MRLGTLKSARSLLDPHTTAAQRLEAVHGDAPQTWVECLLALTGVDALRCPRCEIGRLILQPLPAPILPTLRDTS